MLSLFPQLLDFQLLGPFILRIGLGLVFVAHGYPKLFGGFQQTAQFFESIGIRPAKFWTAVSGTVEFFGGILLLIGLFTQLAAAFIAINMIVAISKVTFKKRFKGGYEFDFVLLLMALSLLVLGPGAFSIDLPL